MICANDRESPSSRASSVASAKNGLGHLAVARVYERTAGRQRPHHKRRVAEFPCRCQGLLGLFAALGRACKRQGAALCPRKLARAQPMRPALCGLSPASAALEPVQTLQHTAPRRPQRLQRRCQVSAARYPPFLAPGERGPQIVDFGFRLLDALLVPCPPAIKCGGQCGVVVAVAGTNRIGIAGFAELLQRILADGFQQPVAGRTADSSGDYEGIIDQQGEQVEDLVALNVPIGGYTLTQRRDRIRP